MFQSPVDVPDLRTMNCVSQVKPILGLFHRGPYPIVANHPGRRRARTRRTSFPSTRILMSSPSVQGSQFPEQKAPTVRHDSLNRLIQTVSAIVRPSAFDGGLRDTPGPAR